MIDYEARLKQRVEEALQEGEKKGEQRGEQRGKQQGEQNGALKTAKNLVDSLKAEKPEASYQSIINKAVSLLKLDETLAQMLAASYAGK